MRKLKEINLNKNSSNISLETSEKFIKNSLSIMTNYINYLYLARNGDVLSIN